MRWIALSLVFACGARSDPGQLQPAPVLAPIPMCPGVGTVDDRSVYWAESHPQGAVRQMPKAGGGTPAAIARETFPRSVVIDDACAYFSVERAIDTIPPQYNGAIVAVQR